MNNIVLHLVRKNTQLKASFIQNQILNHIEFEPKVIFYENRSSNIDGGFASVLPENVIVHELEKKHIFLEKVQYKILKQINGISTTDLLKQIKLLNPRIIHLHYGTDAGLFLKAIRNINIPKVVSFYGYECSGFPKRFLGLGRYYLKYRTFRYADKILAMSEDMKNDLIEIGCPEEKIVVHYHGAKVKRFKAKHNYKEEAIVRFLIISGFTAQKGHVFPLKSFKKALKFNTNIRLTIVGEGSEKEEIIQTITNLKLQHYVDIKSFVVYGSQEHIKYFADYDVFIHPSLTDINGDKEGIPGAIVEAMAAGLPILSTFHAGIPFIIENEVSGLLVKERDIDDLAKKIVEISINRNLREQLGLKGQKYALEYLDLSKKEKDLERIYINLQKKI